MAHLKQATPDVDYVQRAQALVPAILAAAQRTETERQIPDDIYDQLQDADLYRLLIPQSFRGAEIDPPAFVQVIETIARADASTAWCLAQTAVCSMAAAYLDPEVAHSIFAKDRRGVLAWGPPSPDAKAIATAGGYRVTGKWMFASGSRQATWLAGHCLLCEADGTPRRTPQGQPIERSMLFPRASAIMTDVWYVVGLRGTGSDNYAVTDLFVPESLTHSCAMVSKIGGILARCTACRCSMCLPPPSQAWRLASRAPPWMLSSSSPAGSGRCSANLCLATTPRSSHRSAIARRDC